MGLQEPRFLKPEEAMKVLRVSRSGFYLLAKRGDIPTVRVGKLILVPSSYVDDLAAKGRKAA